jgi:hypothetical protein
MITAAVYAAHAAKPRRTRSEDFEKESDQEVMKAAGLLVACGLCLLVASSASAALPEIGRCAKVESVKEGHKKVFSGKYTDKTCTKESTSGHGKYEWSAGPGEEKQFESPGTLEPATLETTAGKQIACANSKQVGEFTGAKTATTEISLYECKEVASGEPCQSLRPEETPPTPQEGTVIAQPAEAELGLVSGGSKPQVGWSFKAKSGSDLFVFECGKSTGLGTKVTIEGSFIGVVSKVIDRMGEEDKMRYSAVKGRQSPSSFEGGTPDALTATFVSPSLQTSSEAIGYAAAEEQSFSEPMEIKAEP